MNNNIIIISVSMTMTMTGGKIWASNPDREKVSKIFCETFHS